MSYLYFSWRSRSNNLNVEINVSLELEYVHNQERSEKLFCVENQ